METEYYIKHPIDVIPSDQLLDFLAKIRNLLPSIIQS